LQNAQPRGAKLNPTGMMVPMKTSM
jgi:hypothetical protein